MTSAIGSVPATADVSRDMYDALLALVQKLEIELEEQDRMREAGYLPRRKCTCYSLHSGPGCKPCLVKRGRAAIAAYEASKGNSPELPDCSTCGRSDPETVAVQTDMFGGQTAQCRACYVAAREREMAVSQ